MKVNNDEGSRYEDIKGLFLYIYLIHWELVIILQSYSVVVKTVTCKNDLSYCTH